MIGCQEYLLRSQSYLSSCDSGQFGSVVGPVVAQELVAVGEPTSVGCVACGH